MFLKSRVPCRRWLTSGQTIFLVIVVGALMQSVSANAQHRKQWEVEEYTNKDEAPQVPESQSAQPQDPVTMPDNVPESPPSEPIVPPPVPPQYPSTTATPSETTEAIKKLAEPKQWSPSGWDMTSGMFFNEGYAATHNLDYSQDSGWLKTGRMFGNLGLFFLGMIASQAIHEFSHFMTASMLGVPFEWPANGAYEFSDGFLLPLWRIPDNTSEGKKVAIAWSGFISNIITSEVILWTPGIPTDNMFVLGMLLHSLFNNIFYPIVDLAKGGYGDIQVLRESGGSVPTVHIILIMHGISGLARLFLFEEDFRNRFLPWVEPNPRGLDLVWRW